MKLDLNFGLKDLDGKEIPDSNMGKLVASLLSQATKGDSLKLYSMAIKLYSGEAFEIDMSDYQILKSFIESSENITVLAKAQILEKLIHIEK